MKKGTGHRLKLGIFVTFAIALFIVAIYYLGQRQQLFSGTFKISAIFKDANGLMVGNNIRFDGINVGTVDKIEIITDTSVQVDMVIDKKIKKFLKKGVKAIVGSEGLMGSKLVNISPGRCNDPEISDNECVESAPSTNIDEILLNMQVASYNAADITDNLDAIITNIRLGKGTIGKLFMDSAFANTIGGTMTNIEEGTEAAKHSFLLRGFFKDKEKAKEKEQAKEQAKEKEKEKAKEKEQAKELEKEKKKKDKNN
jgi:phospholipid/cholesterol/gamma-HCH transport system substrate-binding protein